jgi:hypothetical protein
MSKVSGRLCIKFKIDTKKYKGDWPKYEYTTFLYNIAKGVVDDWDGYYEGVHISIGEDDYVELDS